MEFLEVLETIRAQDASPSRLFDHGDGSTAVMQRASRIPDYGRKLVKAAQLVAEVRQGRRPFYHLQEAMTTSDFPLLFGDIIDRTLLGNYMEWPNTWGNYVSRKVVRDFRTANSYAIDGGMDILDVVPEQGEYPESSLSETRYQISVQKRGRKMPFSWESFVNDDLDALNDIPRRFGVAAARSEQRASTELFFDSSGPHASLYTAGNANIINTTNGASENNPALDIVALQDALIVLSNQVDSDGQPIFIEMVELIVPPALDITANNIMNALQIEINGSGGDSNHKLITRNWMSTRFRVSVDPYIPLVATSNGNTSWILVASTASGRPAAQMAFLRGHESPSVWMKSPNAMRVGGGQVNPMEGDFDTDSYQYRVRHVFGTGLLDPKMTVGSNGSGA